MSFVTSYILTKRISWLSRTISTLFLISITLPFPGLLIAAEKQPFNVAIIPSSASQGDVLLLTVRPRPPVQTLEGWIGEDEIFFTRSGEDGYIALLGIDMSLEPGRHIISLSATGKRGNDISQFVDLEVTSREFGVDRFTFPEEVVELSKEDEERAEMESERMKRIFRDITPSRYWRGNFLLPVKGKPKNNFGRRRILNGVEKSPHSGLDITAPLGRIVIASNRGKVALTDDQFFGGKTVVIDHGRGLFTTYMHLSEISVKEGDMVEKGGKIGKIGDTGRSKGPHLHWGVKIGNARVDPLKLLKVPK